MKRMLVVIFAALAFVCNAASQEGWREVPDAASIVEAFNSANAAVKSISCRFTEEKYVDVLENRSVATGRFSYSAPGDILIEYDSGDSIRIEGDSMTVVSGGRISSVNLAANRQYQRMSTMFSGKDERKSRLPEVKAYSRDGRYMLTFVMKMGGISGTVEALVDSSDMSMDSFRMKNGADYTEYRFTDKVIGR
ncbi:MAG: hypothetical protein NC115_04120 [Bacteroidales bacterium]|nr:hypothetical protein [Bacteroides sp.]MCM1199292.1 hypothetical protein [Clostridium sp.]MCM1501838.1 hypothetical protein [Bacteroidales bacterium]